MPKTEAQRAARKRWLRRWYTKHPEKELASIKKWVKNYPDNKEAKKCLAEHEPRLLKSIKKKQAQ